MSDNDEDDLEIIETSINTINSDEPDADDLRFQLRKEETKLKALFPHIQSSRDLDLKELLVARAIIKRGNQSAKSDVQDVVFSKNPPEGMIGRKRSSEVLSTTTTRETIPANQSKLKSTSSLLDRNRILPSYGSLSNGSLRPSIRSSTTVRWNGVENMKLIGNQLVNMDNLLQNAPKFENTTQMKTSQKAPTLSKEKNTNSEKLFTEIDQLLNRRSAHEHEADDEWHEHFQKRLKTLETQEWKDQKKQQIQFFIIPAFECTSCQGFITELFPSLCKDKNHVIHSIKAVKRFFVCRNCNRKDYTLTNQAKGGTNSGKDEEKNRLFMPPKRNCVCGKDDWILPRTNALENRKEGLQSLVGETLVTSASEWTSRQDKLNMASRVSSLDK